MTTQTLWEAAGLPGTQPPPWRCWHCRRIIPKGDVHFAVDELRHVLCWGCFRRPQAHAEHYPDCLDDTHTMHDHTVHAGFRGGIWSAIAHGARQRGLPMPDTEGHCEPL